MTYSYEVTVHWDHLFNLYRTNPKHVFFSLSLSRDLLPIFSSYFHSRPLINNLKQNGTIFRFCVDSITKNYASVIQDIAYRGRGRYVSAGPGHPSGTGVSV